MGRYTDANAMLEYLNLMYDKQYDMDEPFNCAVLGAINYIKHRAQTIDIVRCGECKYRKHRVDFQNDYCIQHSKVLYSTDGYCSWGEREGE